MTDSKLKELSAEFPPEKVKQRTGKGGLKLDYISIDDTINRLNDVLGTEWSFQIDEVQYGAPVYVRGTLEALGKKASGIGAATNSDPDDAVKTALAEAIKKAGHQFGIGLYLWDAEKRDEIAKSRTTHKEPTVNKGLPF